jgi:adenine-specific DNA methylase
MCGGILGLSNRGSLASKRTNILSGERTSRGERIVAPDNQTQVHLIQNMPTPDGNGLRIFFHEKLPLHTMLESDNPPALFASRLALKEGNNKKPIYRIHKWWARRLGPVFRAILLGAVTPAEGSRAVADCFYARNNLSGLTVLDPFVGGGTTIVEAAKAGANVIGIDIDPVACFITQKELEPYKEDKLLDGFRHVKQKVESRILRLYRTRLSDGREGTIIYAFWVDILRCPKCGSDFAGHPHFQLSRDRKNKRQTVFCVHCGRVHVLPLRRLRFSCHSCHRVTEVAKGPVSEGRVTCPKCGAQHKTQVLYYSKKPLPQRLFALEVLVDNTNERVFKKATKRDRALYDQACRLWRARRRKDRFVPRASIPTDGRDDPRPLCYGHKRYADLFNSRQLLSLSYLAEAISTVQDIPARELLATAFSDSLAANNMYCLYAFDYQKLTPLFGHHAFRKVTRPVENNVWGTEIGRGSFIKCFRKLLQAKRYAARPFESRYHAGQDRPERIFTGEIITPTLLRSPRPTGTSDGGNYAVLLNQSSERMKRIRSRTVDLILTDPPYYDNLPYSELSDFYHVWLRRLPLESYKGKLQLSTPISKSLYVRRDHPTKLARDRQRFANGLGKVFRECHRVLKNDGLMVFTFHHNEPRAWAVLVEALHESKFRITNVFPVRSEGKSEFHSADGNLKWDAVFCCRKLDRKSARDRLSNPDVRSAWARADISVRAWKRRFRSTSLEMTPADERSLRYAFAAMHLGARKNPSREMQALIRHIEAKVTAGRVARPAQVARARQNRH